MRIWADAADDHLCGLRGPEHCGRTPARHAYGLRLRDLPQRVGHGGFVPLRHRLEELLTDIYHNILDFIEIPVDFAVSEEGTLAELPKLAGQAREALECTFVLSKQNIIHYGDLKAHSNTDFRYPEQTERELLTVMYSNEAEKSSALIEEFFCAAAAGYAGRDAVQKHAPPAPEHIQHDGIHELPPAHGRRAPGDPLLTR